MIGDHVATHTGSRGPRPRRTEPGDLLQGLERLRAALRDRLDLLDRLVRDRLDAGANPAEAASAREHALQLRIDELELRQARLVADARRREQDVLAALEQIEGDRALLADAWERLERERIDGGSAPAPRRPGTPAPVAAVFAPAPAPAPASATPEARDAIAQAILRQFETLRDDVRRHGGGGRRAPM